MPLHSFDDYVQQLAALVTEARGVALGAAPDYPRPAPAPGAPVALIFSPHPDDEVIIGGWALRLLRQSRWRVVNIAVTQGSNKARQAARWAELAACCRSIGFELEATAPNGLEGVNPRVRSGEPDRWRTMVETMAALLRRHQPRAIFYPHEGDWNSTHVGTHYLVADALLTLPASFRCAAIETEFWAQMPTPNVLVESSTEELGALVGALSHHVGEVQRNPYHLTMPAWMMDNVRRGGEWVGGQGQAAPDFLFGTLYRLRRWADGTFGEVAVERSFLGAARQADEMIGRALGKD
jgi:LmbE family N-acetylglucosaminyl deacetylase